MKDLLIIGSQKCGKSTLATMISEKYPCEIIRGDCICVAISEILIHKNLYSSSLPVLNSNEQILLYQTIYQQIRMESQNKNRLIIIDSFQIDIPNIVKAFKDNCEIYCLGMCDIEPKKIFDYIRSNDSKENWSYTIEDSVLMEFCKSISIQSKNLEKECNKYNCVKFFDTSKNRKQQLQNIFKDIENNIFGSY